MNEVGGELAEPLPHPRGDRRDGQVGIEQHRGDTTDAHHLEAVVLLDPRARGEEESLVATPAQVGGESGHGAGDAVHPRQKALGDDRHAHPR